MKKALFVLVLILYFSTSKSWSQNKLPVSPNQDWPVPIPCRTEDNHNKNLFVMTLGEVDTPLANGIFDPQKDLVTLNNGHQIKNYYKDSLNITYFSPIDKSHFHVPPSGWCSWYFYYQEINEEEIKENAKWIADNLKDYGAEYVQIDDGWQGKGHGNSDNRDWTTINKRFSGGMDNLAKYIKSLGLKPGIWLAPHGQSNPDIIKKNPNVFLLKPDGTSISSTWEGEYLIDPSRPEAQTYLKDLFSTLSGWGYEYFKIDGQPIVTREFRNHKEEMQNPVTNTDLLYRQTLKSIREGIGDDSYLVGCWVVPLEGIGIMNGSRTSGDVIQDWQGFKTALRATMQYYFLHNVAWYTDPDVMIARAPMTLDQVRAWATLEGLTGQAVLTSDRLKDLSQDRVDIIRKVYPATNVRPLDLFPSGKHKNIWDLKINHLNRNYDVVGLFNFDETKSHTTYVSWEDLGIVSDKPVHVFDFWNQEYLGSWDKGISMNMKPTSSKVLTLIPSTDQIQLISTNRHITQGWVDLVDLHYNENNHSFSGKSKIIKNDPYALQFAFPIGKNFMVRSAKASTISGELPVAIKNHQGWAVVEITSAKTTEVTWEVVFEPTNQYHFPVEKPHDLSVKNVGFDGAVLSWGTGHQPASGYQVYLNDTLLGFTPNNQFSIPNLDPNIKYNVKVSTVWNDGTSSKDKAEMTFKLSDLLDTKMYLDELEPTNDGNGWRISTLNHTILGKVMKLNGKTYEHGIGVPSNSEVEFNLKNYFKEFSAVVGIDEENNKEGNAEFILKGDGEILWRSGFINRSDGSIPIHIAIKGINKLTLQVKRGDGGSSGDQTNWADATLLR